MTARALNSIHRTKTAPARRPLATPDFYPMFSRLDGSHPWKHAVPEGYVAYPVRRLEEAKVAYFNFALAKEMGLIGQGHPHRLNPQLTQRILDAFAIQIINEFDQHKAKRAFSPAEKTHMATRYLQLQHPDKAGRTSGDGRSIWNGCIRHRGVTWDVSSRGTGVTRLSPGSVAAKMFLRTGNTRFGYGCGLADLDELYGAMLMSEIFNHQGLETERVLAIIDVGNGVGIGVRAAPNLFRPAHLLSYLRQRNRKALRRAFDFIIDRQYQNGEWSFAPGDNGRYAKAAREIAVSFARQAARWEIDHIFVWLAWDGDNVLLNGGIIDYGSVRQFGLRHDDYRYDDIERLSTSLNEQYKMARQIVQMFLQMDEYLRTGRYRPVSKYKDHEIAALFDQTFETARLDRFLFRVGLSPKYRTWALTDRRALVESLHRRFTRFERAKTRRKKVRLPDGYNRPAIFNMRRFLYHLPQVLVKRKLKPLSARQLFKLMHSFTASSRDLAWRPHYAKALLALQDDYLALFQSLPGGLRPHLLAAVKRSKVINRQDRITGNAIDLSVREVLSWREKGIPDEQIQRILEGFIHDQILVPATDREEMIPAKVIRFSGHNRLLSSLMTIVYDYSEDV